MAIQASALTRSDPASLAGTAPDADALSVPHTSRSQIVDTDRMGQWHLDRPPGRAGSPAWNAVRWMLLAAVLAGLFGMHVLTDGDDASVHGDLAPVPVAQPSSGGHVMPSKPPEAPTAFATNGRAVNAWSGAAVSGAPNGGLGAGHGMAQCVLFLLTVGSALLLALLASRWPAMTRGVLAVVPATRVELRRRGPPGPHRPRFALCVTRI